jgi:molecular chaperone DnaK (HSP70)
MAAGGSPLDLSCELQRTDLVRLTGDLVLRTLSTCRSVLRAARITSADVDAVYLYGRSTRAKEVLAGTSRLFGKVPVRLPDDATALGAAVMAGG